MKTKLQEKFLGCKLQCHTLKMFAKCNPCIEENCAQVSNHICIRFCTSDSSELLGVPGVMKYSSIRNTKHKEKLTSALILHWKKHKTNCESFMTSSFTVGQQNITSRKLAFDKCQCIIDSSAGRAVLSLML